MFYSAHVVHIGFLNSQISVLFLVSFLLVSRLRAGELSEPLGFLSFMVQHEEPQGLVTAVMVI